MQITQNLKLKQSQSLVMTPQLQQAIKLLQLNNLELTELVNKELEENPFLENETNEENVEKFEDETNDLSESFESGESIADEPKNEDYDNRWDTDLSYQSYSKSSDRDSIDAGSVVEKTLSEQISLKTILKKQAELEFKSETEKKIAELLIDYIEPSGWMITDIEELSNFSGFEKEKIESILLKMQNFEPNGVFARNLKECLIIQLKNEDKLNNHNKKIIENLELLGEGNLKELQKITNLKEEEIKYNVKTIRLLNPGRTKYSDENNNIFNPDVIVTKNNQNWDVELNNSTLPKVTVNQEYINEIESLNCSESDKKYITENLNSAKWLIKAIEQRNLTTLKISAEIVNQQKLFFEKGKKYLKPMILKDVAKKINMHESTVSRVTSEKLMLTPRGIFEMKIFFSASICGTNDGDSFSAASVRESLRKLISDEPMNNPFSDEILVNKLQSQGISLARRTVAKYRELLNIPSSSIRRRMMKIQNLNL